MNLTGKNAEKNYSYFCLVLETKIILISHSTSSGILLLIKSVCRIFPID